MNAGSAEVVGAHGLGGFVLHAGDPGLPGRNEAAGLLNACLGDGFVQEPDLAAILAGRGTLVRACGTDGVLLGTATARVLNQASVYELQQRLHAAGVEKVLVGNLIGELKSSAVAPQARRQGIGAELVRGRLEYLKSLGCRYVVSASWLSGGGAPTSLGLLERAGFERLAVIPAYWAEEQKAAGWLCSDCGTACRCSAIIMILDFGS